MKLDLEALLTPISAGKPAGEPLRYTGVYEAVEAARREDDPALPQGVWKTDLKRADWKEVARLCLDALETRSKDLQLAAWLFEAWIRLEGLPGAAAGISVLAALSESFWDTVHPLPQDGDLGYRLAPLEWVADRMPDAVRSIPVSAPGDGDARVVTSADLEGARHLDRLAKSDPEGARAAEARGRISFDRFLVSVSLTPTPFYVGLVAEARQALDALDGLASLLGRLAGGEAPSFQKLGDALFALQHFAQRVLDERRDRGEEIAVPEEGEEGEFAMPPDFHGHDQDDEEEGGAFYAGSPVRSRAEAYRRLAEAADYLLRTEPHSPTPYLVRRAVAWGGMSLGELLEELVQTDSDLKAIYTLLGMRERS